MKRSLLYAFLFNICPIIACVARADTVAGVDEYVSDAYSIVVVRAQTADEAAEFPPPNGRQRVFVKRVFKGLDSAQEFLVAAGKLIPGKEAMVLFKFDSGRDSAPDGLVSVWPVDGKGIVYSGDVPQNTMGDGIARDTQVPWEVIKEDVIQTSPEEAGLYGQVIDALFFPEKFKALATKDPRRAAYVRFVIAIHDFERDIGWLARLLESPDKEIRAGAEARLKNITGADVSAPKGDTPLALNEWSAAWAKQTLPAKPPEWPPVPADLKMPPDAFPAPLLNAVGDGDADAFAKAFADWLDSGAIRDRGISFAMATLRSEIKDNPFFEPDPLHEVWPHDNIVQLFLSAGFMIPAPRLPEDLLINPKVPAVLRIKYIAILADYLNQKRMEQDRAARLAFIRGQDAGSEAVRRAAFWEVGPENSETARSVALEKIASLGGKKSQQLLMAQYLAGNNGRAAPSSDALNAARASIRAGNKEFINALLEYMRTHEDPPAGWGGRLMCQEGQEAAIPIMLQWLKSKNPQIRSAGALNLCFIPRRESALRLIEAIHAEQPAKRWRAGADSDDADESDSQQANIDGEFIEPKQMMLLALELTGDPRGLDTLLDAAEDETMPSYRRADLLKGLARIGDKKALPELVKIALSLERKGVNGQLVNDDQENDVVLYEAVRAFLYIQTHDKEYRPDDDLGNQSTNPDEIKKALPLIEKWQKEHAQ